MIIVNQTLFYDALYDFEVLYKSGLLVYVYAYNRSEQTDPRKALPTISYCWMGFWIAPSALSELIC